MAKLKTKGTLLQQEVGNAYATVAQVTDISTDGLKSESVETDSLDNTSAGIPKTPTGRVDPGSFSGEMIYDPALAGHKSYLAALVAGASENFKIVYTDNSNWTFTAADMSFGQNIKMGDVVRASFGGTLADLPTTPS